MIGTAEEAATTTTLLPSRDERLIPYLLVATGALVATLLSGEPALAGLAVPFMLALAVGLRQRGPLTVTARVVLDAEQVLEGDVVCGRVVLSLPGQLDARVMVHHAWGRMVEGGAWELVDPGERAELPFRLLATQWGRRPAGEVWVRLSGPLGLLTWTGRVATMPVLRVLPATERLTKLLDPPEARAALGAHRSARYGDGHEFAELRPYIPGDRLRALNWPATARHRRPFVNRHHLEVSGDVVIAVDVAGDASTAAHEVLARAARAAWALAAAHLQENDRVGLAGIGGATRWLSPGAGRRAKYQLLEALLGIGGGGMDGVAPYRDDGAGWTIPAAALLVVLTPLHDPRTVRLLQRWRARGRAVAVVLIETADLLTEPREGGESLARRVWTLELDGRRRHLAQLGIPVMPMAAGDPVGPLVSALRRARQGRRVRLGR